MAEPKLDPYVPPGLHLVSAFLAMEPTDCLVSLARESGGGLVTETVQRFIWDCCISKSTEKGNTPYLKNFVKKLILEIESSHDDSIVVLDELYEQYGRYMTSLKDDISGTRVCKSFSFLFPNGSRSPSCPKSGKLVVPLHCSINMLEGDTGCSVWPSSLYLSEFVLSFPDIFSNKTCFEIGSGVGLVGICLSHVKASKVILSDGDLSTLANMKFNLELNQLRADSGMPGRNMQDQNREVKAEMDNNSQVKCIHLPWESATMNELQEFMPDIVLGADIIYDPSSLPYLVQVLAILLNQTRAHLRMLKDNCQGPLPETNGFDSNVKGADEYYSKAGQNDLCLIEGLHNGSSNAAALRKRPMAYIASVIRNIDTFNCFLRLAEQANLSVTDITKTQWPFDLLPYMQSYNRSSIRLFCIASK